MVGFEALMLWQHHERGWVAPSVFMPLAETSDLIVELSSLAVREAVEAARSWIPSSGDSIAPFVTVNFSASQFQDPGLTKMFEEALQESGLAPERLIIEITEITEITESSALMDVTETMHVMERHNRLGVSIALDAFGTGFSSLSYLVLWHSRFIEIDQSFVRPKNGSVHNDTLLETIIWLGRKLDMTMLAEGIEARTQLERLRSLGCEVGQGFLFSPAVLDGEIALDALASSETELEDESGSCGSLLLAHLQCMRGQSISQMMDKNGALFLDEQGRNELHRRE